MPSLAAPPSPACRTVRLFIQELDGIGTVQHSYDAAHTLAHDAMILGNAACGVACFGSADAGGATAVQDEQDEPPWQIVCCTACSEVAGLAARYRVSLPAVVLCRVSCFQTEEALASEP